MATHSQLKIWLQQRLAREGRQRHEKHRRRDRTGEREQPRRVASSRGSRVTLALISAFAVSRREALPRHFSTSSTTIEDHQDNMTAALVVVGIVVFVLFMVFFQNVNKWCGPKEPSDSLSNDCAVIYPSKVEMPPLTPESTDRAPTPQGAYAIDIEDDAVVDRSTAVRKTRVISFIRFSGYTDSEASISERSTGLSSWSSFSLERGSTKSEPEEVEAAETSGWVRHKRLPYLDGYDDVDTVEIGMMKGFAEKNMLSFKPPRPRMLKWSRAKKPVHATHTPSIFLL